VELVTASGERLRLVDRCRYLGVFFTIVAAPLGLALTMPNVDSFGRLTPFSVKRAGVHPNL